MSFLLTHCMVCPCPLVTTWWAILNRSYLVDLFLSVCASKELGTSLIHILLRDYVTAPSIKCGAASKQPKSGRRRGGERKAERTNKLVYLIPWKIPFLRKQKRSRSNDLNRIFLSTHSSTVSSVELGFLVMRVLGTKRYNLMWFVAAAVWRRQEQERRDKKINYVNNVLKKLLPREKWLNLQATDYSWLLTSGMECSPPPRPHTYPLSTVPHSGNLLANLIVHL